MGAGNQGGCLTQTQRELLLGEIDNISERALEQRMVRLRARVRRSIIDLALVKEHLDDDELELIFNPRSNSEFSEDLPDALGHSTELLLNELEREGRLEISVEILDE